MDHWMDHLDDKVSHLYLVPSQISIKILSHKINHLYHIVINNNSDFESELGEYVPLQANIVQSI